MWNALTPLLNYEAFGIRSCALYCFVSPCSIIHSSSSGTVFLAVMTLIHHQGAASCMSQFTSYMQMWFKTSMTFVQVTWWAMLQGFTGHLMWDEAQPREDLCTFTFMYH